MSNENNTNASAPRNLERVREPTPGKLHDLIFKSIQANFEPLNEQILAFAQRLNQMI